MKMFEKKKEIVKSKYKGSKRRYYSLDQIDKTESLYRVIFGERSNGKTFAVLYKGLMEYLENGWELAYVRRWQEDIRPRNAGILFLNFEMNDVLGNVIEKLTNGRFNSVKYASREYTLIHRDVNGDVDAEDMQPFCRSFAISDWEHDKSTPHPRIHTILFDEFLTRTHYLPDEYTLFNNLLSTIIRDRGDLIVYMVANTVNFDSPYFSEMGLKHVRKMKQGDIDIYQFTEELSVAVEYCEDTSEGKASNKYFAFDNPALKMITKGTWQTEIYPHLQRDMKYGKNEIAFTCFIKYLDSMLQLNVIDKGAESFIYIHYKTTEIRNVSDVLFTFDVDNNPYHLHNFLHPDKDLGKNILRLWQTLPVFYQSNEVGELMRNYLIKCE